MTKNQPNQQSDPLFLSLSPLFLSLFPFFSAFFLICLIFTLQGCQFLYDYPLKECLNQSQCPIHLVCIEDQCRVPDLQNDFVDMLKIQDQKMSVDQELDLSVNLDQALDMMFDQEIEVDADLPEYEFEPLPLNCTIKITNDILFKTQNLVQSPQILCQGNTLLLIAPKSEFELLTLTSPDEMGSSNGGDMGVDEIDMGGQKRGHKRSNLINKNNSNNTPLVLYKLNVTDDEEDGVTYSWVHLCPQLEFSSKFRAHLIEEEEEDQSLDLFLTDPLILDESGHQNIWKLTPQLSELTPQSSECSLTPTLDNNEEYSVINFVPGATRFIFQIKRESAPDPINLIQSSSKPLGSEPLEITDEKCSLLNHPSLDEQPWNINLGRDFFFWIHQMPLLNTVEVAILKQIKVGATRVRCVADLFLTLGSTSHLTLESQQNLEAKFNQSDTLFFCRFNDQYICELYHWSLDPQRTPRDGVPVYEDSSAQPLELESAHFEVLNNHLTFVEYKFDNGLNYQELITTHLERAECREGARPICIQSRTSRDFAWRFGDFKLYQDKIETENKTRLIWLRLDEEGWMLKSSSL